MPRNEDRQASKIKKRKLKLYLHRKYTNQQINMQLITGHFLNKKLLKVHHFSEKQYN